MQHRTSRDELQVRDAARRMNVFHRCCCCCRSRRCLRCTTRNVETAVAHDETGIIQVPSTHPHLRTAPDSTRVSVGESSQPRNKTRWRQQEQLKEVEWKEVESAQRGERLGRDCPRTPHRRVPCVCPLFFWCKEPLFLGGLD